MQEGNNKDKLWIEFTLNSDLGGIITRLRCYINTFDEYLEKVRYYDTKANAKNYTNKDDSDFFFEDSELLDKNSTTLSTFREWYKKAESKLDYENIKEDSEFVYKTGEPELGDFLECHTDLIMEGSNKRECIKGHPYRIMGISDCGNEFWIYSASGCPHYFDIHEVDEDYQEYTKWFKLKQKRYG